MECYVVQRETHLVISVAYVTKNGETGELTVMAINCITYTHLVYPTLVHVGTLCIEMVFPITGIVRAGLLQLHGHIKKDRKWNVNSKCNTFLVYVLHLLRQLPGCSWKKNDLFINQVHYFSSLEEEKMSSSYFPLPTSSNKIFSTFIWIHIHLLIHSQLIPGHLLCAGYIENIEAKQVILVLKHLSI